MLTPPRADLPKRPPTGVRNWLLMAAHAAVFALVLVLYPRMTTARPDVFDTNPARLALPAWGALLLLHLLLAYFIDGRIQKQRVRLTRIQERLRREAIPHPIPKPAAEDGFAPLDDIPQFQRPPSPISSRRSKKTPPPRFYNSP